MFVSKVSLVNFRNYQQCQLLLRPGRNVLIGENAQGKSNFLEAIELLATCRSPRADKDADLILWNSEAMSAKVDFVAGGSEESLCVRMARTAGLRPPVQSSAAAGRPPVQSSNRVEKLATINGVQQKSMTELLGRLLVVSFASHDLNLLRGGPKFRRDWIDSLILKLRPAFISTFSDYQKSVAQRNRLLKSIFERGKVTVTDQDQLLVWDKQVARFGAAIIKQRLAMLARLLPLAENQQQRISRQKELLSIRYMFKASEQLVEETWLGDEAEAADGGGDKDLSTGPLTAMQLQQMEEIELAKTLMRLLKERRAEEIRRKQTTVGPHRDDLIICLNDKDAVTFASQGQQRSIVLSLKMAEVALIRECCNDSPVLLLDDVLAELDEFRQALLMSVTEEGLQTIITTTHLTGFDPRWLEGSVIFKVHAGVIEQPLPC
ncbi:MAG TPA: DNA replication and repair protein RecF [Candidatus Obscuribacterales bacterium]